MKYGVPKLILMVTDLEKYTDIGNSETTISSVELFWRTMMSNEEFIRKLAASETTCSRNGYVNIEVI